MAAAPSPEIPPSVARLPAPPPARRGLWALPMLLSALFVAGVMAWAQRNDRDEREELRRTMISDALSTEAQLRGRLDVEAAHLRTLASQLRKMPRNASFFQPVSDIVPYYNIFLQFTCKAFIIVPV